MRCKTCGQEVGMIAAMSHMMGNHGRFRCKACMAYFDTEKELMAHQKKEHM